MLSENHQVLKVFSEICGVLYLGFWGFCNLPQLILIQRRKSVAGFSITFQLLNLLGFTWYLIYLIYGFIYQHKHNTTKSILWQDFLWCGTTLIIVYLITLQCWIYRKTINETIHPFYQICMISIIVITCYNGFLVNLGRLEWYVVAPPGASGADAYSFMHFLGYSKTFISCIKYIPAIALNFRLKNTAGFSITQVLFDVGGAVTSFTQSMLNAYITPNPDGSPDFNTVFGNLPKLLLSLESLFFCSILLFQHYGLYRHNNHLHQQQQHHDDIDDLNGGSHDDIDHLNNDAHIDLLEEKNSPNRHTRHGGGGRRHDNRHQSVSIKNNTINSPSGSDHQHHQPIMDQHKAITISSTRKEYDESTDDESEDPLLNDEDRSNIIRVGDHDKYYDDDDRHSISTSIN